jgi:DDE superfamily endonuclease
VAAARAVSRRARAGIPHQVRHKEKWRLALEMLDEMTGPGGWGVLGQAGAAGGARPVVAADAAYGDNATFRMELEQRGWQYVVAVKGTTSAHAGDARPVTPQPRHGPGRPRKPAYPSPPANLRTLALANADKIQQVTWRQGTKATKGNPTASMASHFLATRIRPASRDIPRHDDGSLPDCWLLAEWPAEADEPTDYWLSDLPTSTPTGELIRLAKIRWRIEMVFTQLTKGPVRASGGGWQDVADLDLVVGDDHAVDEQLHQLAPLFEGGGGESGSDGLAERFDAIGHGLQFQTLFGGGV